ncbi:Riboflavin transporter RibZ [Geodia barretti]|uniref:Riboflavin transporter RibZ n=1 Tax=Geodia barretti TaxID=519541 RepID=A0AA35U3N0_GEOBA|nr:Riboflavin transporter RibZ [Geodia barretti]
MLASGLIDKPIYRWWVFSAVALGTLTSVINHGGMSVALPTIAQYFDADLATVQWVVIAEGLTVSALLLPMGRLSDIVGRKRIFLSGLVIFIIAAVFAATSGSIIALIAAKALQGLGAAMTQGTGMAMVTSIFPASERGKGIGSHASVVGTGGVMGPIAGGFLITALDWRWLFYINIFMGLATIIVVLLIIRGDVFRQDSRNRSYDYGGAALSTAVLLTFLLAAALGYTPALVGFALLPNAASRIIMGPLSGRLSDRYGWRPFNIIGLFLSAGGLLILATLTTTSSIVVALAGILIQSIGSGLFQSPNSASIFSAADPARHGVVAAFVNLSRNSGNVTGTAIAASIVTAVMLSSGYEVKIDAVLEATPGSGLLESFMSGLKTAFLIMAGLQVIGGIVSIFKTDTQSEQPPEIGEPQPSAERAL